MDWLETKHACCCLRARAKVIFVYDLLQATCTIYKICRLPMENIPTLRPYELERVLCLACCGVSNMHRFRVSMFSEQSPWSTVDICLCTNKNFTKCSWGVLPPMSSSLPIYRGIYPLSVVNIMISWEMRDLPKFYLYVCVCIYIYILQL